MSYIVRDKQSEMCELPKRECGFPKKGICMTLKRGVKYEICKRSVLSNPVSYLEFSCI